MLIADVAGMLPASWAAPPSGRRSDQRSLTSSWLRSPSVSAQWRGRVGSPAGRRRLPAARTSGRLRERGSPEGAGASCPAWTIRRSPASTGSTDGTSLARTRAIATLEPRAQQERGVDVAHHRHPDALVAATGRAGVETPGTPGMLDERLVMPRGNALIVADASSSSGTLGRPVRV